MVRSRLRTALRVGLTVGLAVLVIAGADAVRWHVFPKRFAEVVPGQLYRSGQLEAWPLRRIVNRYHIRTILALLNREPGNPGQDEEHRLANEKGIQIVNMAMPGDGLAAFDLLERAAAMMANTTTHPLLVHCEAGVNRTGAVYAVWRMKYCGWNVERTIQEAERYGGWSAELGEHLRRYYRTRIAGQNTNSMPTMN